MQRPADSEEFLRDKLLALSELQRVDLETESLRKSAEAFPKEIAEHERQLKALHSQVQAERAKLNELETQRQTIEQNLNDDRDKVRKWEGRLAEQRSTREYSALAREIDIAKKGQQTMQEEIVALTKQIAIQQDLTRTKENQFTERSTELSSKLDELRAKIADSEKEISRVQSTREAIGARVDRDLMRRYDAIRKKRMPALVPVTAIGTCTGCRMNLRPQMYNRLLSTQGYDVCPSCSRMVYAAEVLDESRTVST